MAKLRVMVVEDEPPILNSICALLEEHEGVEVVQRAINGRRALDHLAGGGKVDLVFSDIKMPVMDGLTLAKHIQQDYPATVMVLISGFQEFEFARSAIQYGVKNYLLKPVSRERIGEILAGVTDELASFKQKEMRAAVRSMAMGTVPARLDMLAGPYGVLLLCEGAFPSQLGEAAEETARQAIDLVAVEERLRALCLNGVVVNGLSTAEKLMVYSATDEVQAEAVARQMYEAMGALCTGPLTGLGQLHEGPAAKLPGRFSRMRAQLYKQVCLFHSGFSFGEQPREQAPPDTNEWTWGLAKAIKVRAAQQISREAQALTARLEETGIPQTAVWMMLERLVAHCYEGRLPAGELNDLRFEVQAVVARAMAPVDFAEELADVLCAWNEAEADTDGQETSRLAGAVAAYIREHHAENSSTRELADRFGVSAAQLSKRFKQHFGVSISEYTNNFRIEVAMAMLRENKKARIKEIALDVGFSDQYYFSKIFKKVTGVWPTEFVQGEGTE